MSVLEIKGLEKSFRSGVVETRVFSGWRLDVEEGEMISLMGPSGSGKTTLLNMIGSIDSPDSGSIIVNGRDITKLTDAEANSYRREEIGFIFQFYNLIPTLTALENVELALEAIGVDRAESERRSRSYLERVGLGDRTDRFPHELSGGEQQRVAIARALAKEPRIVLADEPTGNLDEELTIEIVELMRRTRDELGVTYIIVTHDVSLGRMMDRIVDLAHMKGA